MSYSKKYLGLSIVSALIVSIFGFSPVQATNVSLNLNDCAPAVILLKGSGESMELVNGVKIPVATKQYSKENTPNVVEFTTNGHEGAILNRLLNNFVNETAITDVGKKVRFIGLEDYPALDVFPEPPPATGNGQWGVTPPNVPAISYASTYISHFHNYYDSFTKGAEAITDFIDEDVARGCDTQYMLVGYSQGAIAIRLAINLLGGDRIVSTYLVGDPWQDADATTFPMQRTIANTSAYTDGIGRSAMNMLADFSALSNVVGVDQSKILPILDWGKELKKSDEIVYRNELINSVPTVSRSLCHEQDPTCGFSNGNWSMDEHLNYFDSLKLAGELDVTFEVSQFDEQVKTLLQSNYELNAPRELKQTPSVKGKKTFYNVAHYKDGDKCSWDENSDGNYETENINCATGYNMLATGGTVKMSVKVVALDSTEYLLSTEDTAAELEIVEQLANLKMGEWYQFHPYGQPEKCVGINQPDNYSKTMEVSDDVFNYTPIISACASSSPEGFNQMAETGKQSFKVDLHNTQEEWINSGLLTLEPGETWGTYPWEEEWVQPVKKLTNGYNEQWYMAKSSTEDVPKMGFEKLSDRNYALQPKIARIVDGKAYYSIVTKDGNCVATENNGSLTIAEGCSEFNQLFSVTHIDANLGELSLEQDIIAPEEVTNVSLNEVSRNKAKISWDTSTDNREGAVRYNVYANDTSNLLGLHLTNPVYEIDISDTLPGSTNTYSVTALDTKGNETSGSLITITTPEDLPLLSKPDTPVLNNISANMGSITINIPNLEAYDTNYVQLYRNGTEHSTLSSGNMYTDHDVTRGSSYSYSYKVYLNNGTETEISDGLLVDLAVSNSPSAPLNLTLNNQPGSSVVDISWDSSTDDFDTNLRYSVYRNGVIVSDSVFGNHFTDSSAPEGVNSYTVTATDYEQQESVHSNVAYVNVIVDTESPSKPELTLLSVDTNSIKFEIQSTDNRTGMLTYNIYRDNQWVDTITGTEVYSDTNLIPGSTYSYTVIAVDEAYNESELSDSLIVTVPAITINIPSVTNLNSIYTTDNIVYLTWDTLEGGMYSYDVYRDNVFQGSTWNTNYIDRNVTEETSYEYTIVTKTWDGNQSIHSGPLLITTPQIMPGPDIINPSSFTMGSWNSGMGKTISLSWSESVDNAGSVTYKIYRDNILIKETTSTYIFYTDTGLQNGIPVEYTVKSVDPTGNETFGTGSFAYTWDGSPGPSCEPDCGSEGGVGMG